MKDGPTIEPKGERDFVNDHDVQAVSDANGNDDEVFKASKIKSVNRPATRQGVKPNDNIPIKKIDFKVEDDSWNKNPNQLRAEEDENETLHKLISNINEKADGQETVTQIPSKKKKGKANSLGVDNTVAKQVDIVSAPGYQKNWKKDMYGEETQLDEGDYHSRFMFQEHNRKAVEAFDKGQDAMNNASSAKEPGLKAHHEALQDCYNKAAHHHLKIATHFAKKCGIKEEDQLDEIGNTAKGRKMLGRYIHGAVGIDRAVDRGGKIPSHMKEENLDEVSSSLLKNYIRKATSDAKTKRTSSNQMDKDSHGRYENGVQTKVGSSTLAAKSVVVGAKASNREFQTTRAKEHILKNWKK